jgi:hypothetical protein
LKVALSRRQRVRHHVDMVATKTQKSCSASLTRSNVARIAGSLSTSILNANFTGRPHFRMAESKAPSTTLAQSGERRESRGAHQRNDYPNSDPRLIVNLVLRAGADGSPSLSHVPVASVPAELVTWIGDRATVSLDGRLLE